MVSLDLRIDHEQGVWHLANQGATSWSDFAVMAAQRCGLDTRLIDPVPGRALGQAAPRPGRVVLHSERGSLMPTLDDALARDLLERGADVLPLAEPAGNAVPRRRVA